jgi:hypothetical protein
MRMESPGSAKDYRDHVLSSGVGMMGIKPRGAEQEFGRSTVEVFGTAWAAPCDVAERNVSTFYRGWRVSPGLVCCV